MTALLVVSTQKYVQHFFSVSPVKWDRFRKRINSITDFTEPPLVGTPMTLRRQRTHSSMSLWEFAMNTCEHRSLSPALPVKETGKKNYKKASDDTMETKGFPERENCYKGPVVKTPCKASIVRAGSMLTWYDLKEVLSRVIWIWGEFIDFTEAQLDDSLRTRKQKHKNTRKNYEVQPEILHNSCHT